MAKFILDGQEYGGSSGGSNVIKLTQAEYDALPNDKLSDDNIYLITDSSNGELTAENLFYDDTEIGLGVNNVQDAIDKLNENVNEQNKNLESCFQSVSDGKALVASAITDKGVTTAQDATFETMANNILAISGFKFNLISSSGYSASKTLSNLTVGKEYLLVLSSYSKSGSSYALQYCAISSCTGGTCTKITQDAQGTGAAIYYKLVAASTTVTIATSDSVHRLFA